MNDIDNILEQTLILSDEFVSVFQINGEQRNNARRQAISLLGAFLSSDTQGSVNVKIMTFRQCLEDFKAESQLLTASSYQQEDMTMINDKIVSSFGNIYYELSNQIQKAGCVVSQEEVLGYYKKAVQAVIDNQPLEVRLGQNRMSAEHDRFNSGVLLNHAQNFLQQQSFTQDGFVAFLNKVINKAHACQSDLLLSVSGVSVNIEPVAASTSITTHRLKRS